jgi:hypothetical protein
MVEIEFSPRHELPREARARGYQRSHLDDFFRDVVDLILEIRAAKASWESGTARPNEWRAFGFKMKDALKANTSLALMIMDVRSWAAGWWRRSER